MHAILCLARAELAPLRCAQTVLRAQAKNRIPANQSYGMASPGDAYTFYCFEQ